MNTTSHKLVLSGAALFLTLCLTTACASTKEGYARPPDQTYLTYPEWYLVYSPAEYAAYVKEHSPTDFPFFGNIGQFWGGYGAVSKEIGNKGYPFNGGYHAMIMVIGASTTVEYTIKGIYEPLIGRLSEMTATHGRTAEDELDAEVAQDYVDFIRVKPWYEYDFARQLKRVWTETGYTGNDLIRKWERKTALTGEYGMKALYGWLIGLGTKAAYDEPLPVTQALIDRLPPDTASDMPELRVLKENADGTALVTLPRYDAFKDYAAKLAGKNVAFMEIAGNRSDILVSVLAPGEWKGDETTYHILFIQPILTRPQTKRVVFSTPVAELSKTLRLFKGKEFTLEHVYDF